MDNLVKCPDCSGDTYNMGENGPVLCTFCKATGKVKESLDFVWVLLYDGSAYSPATPQEFKSENIIWEHNGFGVDTKTQTRFKRFPYVKPEHFKQDNPQDQFVVLLNSLEGSLLNAEDGLITSEHFQKRVRDCLKDLKRLKRHMTVVW